MPKAKCPYTFPHRSRAAMLAYLESAMQGYVDGRMYYPVSFNVKARGLSLSREKVWEMREQFVPAEVRDDPRNHAPYRSAYDEAYDAVAGDSDWFSMAVSAARDNVTESDTHKSLWGGRVDPSIEFRFVGRTGGHLVVSNWAYQSLYGRSKGEWIDFLATREFDYVKSFYQFYRHWEQDFHPDRVREELTYHHADMVYVKANDCWEEHLAKWLVANGPELRNRRITVRRNVAV